MQVEMRSADIYIYIDCNAGSYDLHKILFGVYDIMATPRV